MTFTESNNVEQMSLDAATSLGSGTNRSVVRQEPLVSSWELRSGSLRSRFPQRPSPSRGSPITAPTGLAVTA